MHTNENRDAGNLLIGKNLSHHVRDKHGNKSSVMAAKNKKAEDTDEITDKSKETAGKAKGKNKGEVDTVLRRWK
jgi:hypothetical protein